MGSNTNTPNNHLTLSLKPFQFDQHPSPLTGQKVQACAATGSSGRDPRPDDPHPDDHHGDHGT